MLRRSVETTANSGHSHCLNSKQDLAHRDAGEVLVACAGVTLNAVATALDLEVRAGRIRAEGDLDFKGTLGIDKNAPVERSAFARVVGWNGKLTASQDLLIIDEMGFVPLSKSGAERWAKIHSNRPVNPKRPLLPMLDPPFRRSAMTPINAMDRKKGYILY